MGILCYPAASVPPDNMVCTAICDQIFLGLVLRVPGCQPGVASPHVTGVNIAKLHVLWSSQQPNYRVYTRLNNAHQRRLSLFRLCAQATMTG
jgi:hypothetical protein